jgi:hypothetical protein
MIMDTYCNNKSGASKETDWSKRIDLLPALSSIPRELKLVNATGTRMTGFGEDEIYANEGKDSSTTETKLHEPPREIMCNKSCNS